MSIQYEIQEEKYYNGKLIIAGLILLCVRLVFVNSLKVSPLGGVSFPGLPALGIFETLINTKAWFHPDIMHVSYFVAFVAPAAMIFSFRSKILNGICFLIIPSVVVSIPTREFIVWFSSDYTLFYRLNYVLMHFPVLIIGIYMLIMRRVYLSKLSTWIAGGILAAWFVFADNKDNGVLDGIYYFIVVVIVSTIWGIFIVKFLLKETDPESPDPLFAPVINVTWK